MADTKVKDLTEAAATNESDVLYANDPNDSDASVKIQLGTIRDALAASGPGVASGQAMCQAGTETIDNTGASTADQLYTTFIAIPQNVTINRIGVYVNTLVAGGLVRLGIYNYDESTGLPGSLLLDAGEVDASTTGNKEITISQALTMGNYCLTALLNNTTIKVRGITATNTRPGIWGGNSSQLTYHGVRGTHSYAALPASFPAVTYSADSNHSALVWVRKA